MQEIQYLTKSSLTLTPTGQSLNQVYLPDPGEEMDPSPELSQSNCPFQESDLRKILYAAV